MSKVTFISYAREDSAFALKLAQDLRATTGKIWIDQLDIRAGADWPKAIEEALDACGRFLVILSPESTVSGNVSDEVSYALRETKTVIPVLHRSCKIPLRLSRLQYVDFTADYDAGLAVLISALEGGAILPQSKFETVTRPARRWWRRTALLFRPRGILGYALHSLFYLSVVVTAGAGAGLIWQKTRDPELPSVAEVWALFSLVFCALANLVDVPAGKNPRRPPVRSLLLWYWPDRIPAKIIHVVFQVLVFVPLFSFPGLVMDENEGGWGLGLGVLLMGGATAALLWAIARRLDARVPRPLKEREHAAGV